MVDAIIKGRPQTLSGEICAPPSKAYTHRMVIAALLSEGVTKISNPLTSNDTKATLQAVEDFGAKVKLQKNCWTVEGAIPPKTPESPIECGESAATLRFMIPVASLAPGSSIFTFGNSLGRRPIIPLLQSLKKLGVDSIFQRNKVEIIGGGMNGGKTTIRANISSQFISGLLFACPKAEKNTEITLTTHLESKNYVQITEEVLNRHGVKICISNNYRRINIPSKQRYNPCNHEVPGDFSSVAFLLAAAAVTSSKLRVKNLDPYNKQGDKAIIHILNKMGSKIDVHDRFTEIEGNLMNPIEIDVKDIPDLVPVCAVLGCYSNGISKIYNAKRLKYKESDRMQSICSELKKMCAEIIMEKDRLIIRGPCSLLGASINPHNDHRIAMACAVAALGAEGETKIQNSECVKKSYPMFFKDLRSLGAEVYGGKFNR